MFWPNKLKNCKTLWTCGNLNKSAIDRCLSIQDFFLAHISDNTLSWGMLLCHLHPTSHFHIHRSRGCTPAKHLCREESPFAANAITQREVKARWSISNVARRRNSAEIRADLKLRLESSPSRSASLPCHESSSVLPHRCR